MTTRIVPPTPQREITSCGQCPNYRNGGGPGMFRGAYCLEKLHHNSGFIVAFGPIPDWCPLEKAS